MTKIKDSKISNELLDELLKDYKNPEDLLGKDGILSELKKKLLERVLHAEMDDHLGYKKHERKGYNRGNSRNGNTKKQVLSGNSKLDLEIPRDRNGDFEPQIIEKGQKRFDGFDEKILAMYARGMSTRDIQSTLLDLYEVEVSAGLISDVTDAVITQMEAWQSRPLEQLYPIVYFDAIVVKIRKDSRVIKQAIHLALGITLEGHKELLGLWVSENEGAKFWLSVMTELKNRGLEDIFIACVDGLTGFPEAIEAVYPKTEVQLCIVHMIGNSTKYVSWKDRKNLCADLKLIYGAATVQEAEVALDTFAKKWDDIYPTVSQLWRNHWEHLIPFFDYTPEVRKVIYTTNAIESLNRSFRKILKTKGAFPNEQSVKKIFYLALEQISKKWTMPIQNWKAALNQFAIRFEGRFSI